MSTYTLGDLGIFLIKLKDKEAEEDLFTVWVNAQTGEAFKDFKDKYYSPLFKTKAKKLSEEEEKRNIENATRFIKPI